MLGGATPRPINPSKRQMQNASTTSRNIAAICEMEKTALARRSLPERVGDVIASHAGKMWFIAAHALWFGMWLLMNLGAHRKTAFDPFPFAFLTMIVSLESIFLSLFILMSQNRSGLQADQRNHLDLQINLLSEDENTKMLQMLQALCEYHNLKIASDPEIRAMAKRTELHEVLSELKDSLPGAEGS
jgi:uncharacterized membrane protein